MRFLVIEFLVLVTTNVFVSRGTGDAVLSVCRVFIFKVGGCQICINLYSLDHGY